MSRQTESVWQRLWRKNPSLDETPSEATSRTPVPTPQERRAWVRYSCDATSSCQPLFGGDSLPSFARVKDISQGGVNLLVSRRFEPGTLLKIEVESRSPAAPPILLAKVVRVARLDNGDWSLGCCFAKPVTEEALQSLV